ncbi:hypothetical protein KEM48_005077 [Puccinia striiformis f. sp. tritici PST-130]|nr:hypothetical protein KEM48_005077 [Puccinia striiformis f. sp. tritici PST-130]
MQQSNDALRRAYASERQARFRERQHAVPPQSVIPHLYQLNDHHIHRMNHSLYSQANIEMGRVAPHHHHTRNMSHLYNDLDNLHVDNIPHRSLTLDNNFANINFTVTHKCKLPKITNTSTVHPLNIANTSTVHPPNITNNLFLSTESTDAPILSLGIFFILNNQSIQLMSGFHPHICIMNIHNRAGSHTPIKIVNLLIIFVLHQ